jgi:hypothetical protein
VEPRQEVQPKTAEPRPAARPARFRLVRLEERIAPSTGGNVTDAGNRALTAVSICICPH